MQTLFVIRDHEIASRCVGFIGGLDLESVWSVTVEPYKSKRSLEQNALYRVWIDQIARDTGNTHGGIHDAVRDELLAPVFTDLFGVTHESRRSTTSLNVA